MIVLWISHYTSIHHPPLFALIHPMGIKKIAKLDYSDQEDA
jgi:hypothetical protein